jgi:hypothetical protein
LNKYIAFYKNKRIEVDANTPYEAQKKVAEILKVKHSYDISVVLTETSAGAIVHSTSEFG